MQKKYQDLRIVFMGTPEFAVVSLNALVQAGCNIVGVITAPDKPGGRGMVLQPSAVKKYAVAHNLFLMQPEKLKNEDFIHTLKELKADVQIVVAFRMLPVVVWDMPPMGTINVHGSLLPKYRGAAPINWAVINGETETGVTTFKLKHEIDTGNILMQEKFAIEENDTAGTVHDTMALLGAKTLVSTIKAIANGELEEIEQPVLHGQENITNEYPHAPKIFTETCSINWQKPTNEIFNLIRGLSPFPTAYTTLQHKKLKIFIAKKEIILHQTEIGQYETDNKTFLKFATLDGFIHCIEVQLEGKKKMPIEDFLRGYKFSN
jgi:methionyl-tRNA formyltransferase